MLLTYTILCGVTESLTMTKTCLILIPTVILVFHVYSVTRACHNRHYQYTATQRRSCVCYGLGALCVFLSVGANLLTTTGLGQRFTGLLKGDIVVRASNVLWAMAVVLFVAGGLPIVNEELERFSSSRGYSEPRRLCRTEAGWTIMEGTGPAYFPSGPPSSDMSPVLGTLIVTSTTGNIIPSEGHNMEGTREVDPSEVQPTRWSNWCTNINDIANTWRQRYQDWIRSESFPTLNCCWREERRRIGSSVANQL